MLPPKLQEILDDLKLYPERQDRIEALISIGQEFKNPSSEDLPRTPEHRVPGCESEAYVDSEPLGSGRRYRFAVDNPQGISAMALAQILAEGVDGSPASEVEQIPDEIIYEIFGRELSMGKSMGLMGMVRMVKAEAKR